MNAMDADTQLMDALFVEKVLAARQRTFEEKFLAGGLLFEAGVERMKLGILMDRPDATDEEVIVEIQRRLDISRQLEREG